MSTLDIAGNSNREVPSFLQSAIRAIDNSSWFKSNGKFCLTCNSQTRNLSQDSIEMLVNYYKYNCGYEGAKVETTEYGKKILSVK
jgi:hypothetical protein